MAHIEVTRARMSRTLRGPLAVAIVPAGCTGEDSANGHEPAAATNASAVAPAESTGTVWPSLESACATCQAAGRVAAGTRLVFATGAGTGLHDYNVLRDFVAATGDLVLTKSIGLPSHGGGRPCVDANSQQYRDLAALMPALRWPCTPAGSRARPSGFWSGVTLADDAKTLASDAVPFSGRNPTAEEQSAVRGGRQRAAADDSRLHAGAGVRRFP